MNNFAPFYKTIAVGEVSLLRYNMKWILKYFLGLLLASGCSIAERKGRGQWTEV